MKTKTSKRTKSQSEIDSEQEKQTSNQPRPILEPMQVTLSKRFKLLSVSKEEEEAKAITTNQSAQKKIPSASKQFSTSSKTNSINQPKDLSLCIPMFPVTFADWVHYQSKCEQIRNLLQIDCPKESIIPWIENNNKQLHGLQTNCLLLAQIQSDTFWNIIIPCLLKDVLQYSCFLNHESIFFLPKNPQGKSKVQMKRTICYFLLAQMFVGLIPPQYHLHKHNVQCTFANYMHRQNGKNFDENQDSLTQKDKINFNKLKALISYFSFMSIEENQVYVKKQQITFQFSIFQMLNQTFMNPSTAQNPNPSLIYDFEEDFGTIAGQVLEQIVIESSKPSTLDDKFNQGKTSSQPLKRVSSFFQIQNVLDEVKFQEKKTNSEFIKFLFQHPQVFAIKLIFPEFPEQTSTFLIKGLKRWSECQYSQGRGFETITRSSSENLSDLPKSTSRVVLVKSPRKQQIEIKNYGYESLRQRIERYMGALMIAMKGNKQKQIVIDFDQMQHKDAYLDFMLIWISISLLPRLRIVFKFNETDQKTVFNVKKIYKYFKGNDIGQMLNVIRGYELFMTQKRKKFLLPQQLFFLDYIKRHVF